MRNFKSDVNVNVFAPVCRIEAIRHLMSMVSEHPEWKIHHVDICNAFCTAKLDKPIYIHMPRCMVEKDPTLKNKKIRVVRALYGHQASPRAFNKHLHDKILKYGYEVSPVDPCLYIR